MWPARASTACFTGAVSDGGFYEVMLDEACVDADGPVSVSVGLRLADSADAPDNDVDSDDAPGGCRWATAARRCGGSS